MQKLNHNTVYKLNQTFFDRRSNPSVLLDPVYYQHKDDDWLVVINQEPDTALIKTEQIFGPIVVKRDEVTPK